MRDLMRQARQVEEVQVGAAQVADLVEVQAADLVEVQAGVAQAADLVEVQAGMAQAADLVEVQAGMAPEQRKTIGAQFSEAVYPHSRLLLSPSKGPS